MNTNLSESKVQVWTRLDNCCSKHKVIVANKADKIVMIFFQAGEYDLGVTKAYSWAPQKGAVTQDTELGEGGDC